MIHIVNNSNIEFLVNVFVNDNRSQPIYFYDVINYEIDYCILFHLSQDQKETFLNNNIVKRYDTRDIFEDARKLMSRFPKYVRVQI